MRYYPRCSNLKKMSLANFCALDCRYITYTLYKVLIKKIHNNSLFYIRTLVSCTFCDEDYNFIISKTSYPNKLQAHGIVKLFDLNFGKYEIAPTIKKTEECV